MINFADFFKAYKCRIDDNAVQQAAAKIISEHFDENNNTEVYRQCLNMIDLTSLNGSDTGAGICSMVNRVNSFKTDFPHLPNVAAICVYPAMVPEVKQRLTEPLGIASVAAGFPASQTFIEIKVAEVAMAVLSGASEIDVVISIGKFLEGKYEEVYEELAEIKSACRNAHLKVILETGDLKTAENIKKASLLAMEAGADFIKTSTGKIPVAATVEATYVMCGAISEYYEKTGKKTGYKPAGGISATADAVKHYTLVKEILGSGWLDNTYFRFGASRLANSLLTSIEGREVKYF
jgi:deoxyribose-phosphate aldolase